MTTVDRAHGISWSLGTEQNLCGPALGLPRRKFQCQWSVYRGISHEPWLLDHFPFHSISMVSPFFIFHFFLVIKVCPYTIPFTLYLSSKPFTGYSEDVVIPHMKSLKISCNWTETSSAAISVKIICSSWGWWWLQIFSLLWCMTYGNSFLSNRHVVLDNPFFHKSALLMLIVTQCVLVLRNQMWHLWKDIAPLSRTMHLDIMVVDQLVLLAVYLQIILQMILQMILPEFLKPWLSLCDDMCL